MTPLAIGRYRPKKQILRIHQENQEIGEGKRHYAELNANKSPTFR